jgi:acetylornithine deacetylase/succinyl-diaminopimelate desuccinylase-like protein
MLARMRLPIVAALLALASLLSPQNPGDLAALQEQALERLQEYIRVDTVNPPGNETRGVEFFGRIFDAEGIPYETAESAPGRGNIWARLEGGDQPALILLHHMDVVPADMEHWTTDPLSGEIRDGFVYGRGTLDTKTLGIDHLQAFLALHAAGRPLNRDVIFMATADEEAGGFYGAGWLAENRPELFDGVGYILNEGGGGSVLGEEPADLADIPADTTIAFEVEVTQKVPWWLQLTAVDEPGHGSRPRVTSSVTRLIQALAKIDDYDFEPRMVPAVDDYFKAIAPDADPRWAKRFANMPQAIRDPAFLLELQLYDPGLHALTRNTCSITMLSGSNKINVVPPSVSAQLDCRLLPDQDPQAFIEQLSFIINDPAISIEVLMGFTPAVSTTDTDLYRIIEEVTARHFPRGKVVPAVSTGFTDSHFFRDMGIIAYGYGPEVLVPSEANRIHGNDERISVQNVNGGVQIVLEIVQGLVYD